ncbi:MAG: hypothetical protein IJ545_00860 [Alphaproteobacteria bacterium]|nr:hypothetical protein [Alphaproteobacteria bacterium]
MKTEVLKSVEKRYGVGDYFEEAISARVLNEIAHKALPKMVWLIKDVVSLDDARIAETQKVLLAASMNGLSTGFSLELMDLSVGASYKLDRLLYSVGALDTKEGRKELWGTEWELPVRLAAGIIRDIRDGVNLEEPTKADLEKSATFAVSRVFIDKKASDKDVWTARDRQNKEIDEFIANYK